MFFFGLEVPSCEKVRLKKIIFVLDLTSFDKTIGQKLFSFFFSSDFTDVFDKIQVLSQLGGSKWPLKGDCPWKKEPCYFDNFRTNPVCFCYYWIWEHQFRKCNGKCSEITFTISKGFNCHSYVSIVMKALKSAKKKVRKNMSKIIYFCLTWCQMLWRLEFLPSPSTATRKVTEQEEKPNF